MADFAQFKPPEKQLSDVTSVQAPVQDTSAATRMSSIATAAGSLGQIATTAFKVSEQQRQADLELQQEQALMEQKQSFEKELLRAKDIADQHGSTSLGFKTFLTMAFDQSQLDFDVKSKMMKDFQSTVLGKSFTELSPEERAFQKTREEAAAAFYFTEFSTEEEKEQGLMNYIQAQKKAASDKAELDSLSLQEARLDLTEKQRTAIQKRLSDKQFSTVANLVSNGRTSQKNKIESIVTRLNNNEISAADAESLLKSAKGELEATIAQMSRNVTDRTRVNALTQPLIDLYNIAIDRYNSPNLLQEIQDANKLTLAKSEFNLLHNNPELADMASMSKLFGHNSVITAEMTLKSAEILNNNRKNDVKPSDVTESTTDNKTYLDLLSSGIDNISTLNPDGSLVIDQQELLANINNTLLGANRYIDPEDPPTQNKQILQWLAQPKVGEYVKANLGKLTPAARTKLADTLVNNAVNYVYPRVQDLTSALFVEEKDPRFKTSKVKKVGGVTEDEVEMTMQGTSIVFRGTSPESQRVADTMNKEVAGALTTYFNATANVSGESFNTVYEREKQVVWPSKYGEPTEDGMFVDTETGEEFEVRDGKRVE